MLFSSIPFLFYFLPCVFVLYFLVPMRWKNTMLLLASLFFYAWAPSNSTLKGYLWVVAKIRIVIRICKFSYKNVDNQLLV